ncbi:hypothetical protein CF326_g8557 [Tilletia indica]|nr:hypothetical protein CF326_g8557 [Tilletia indica]
MSLDNFEWPTVGASFSDFAHELGVTIDVPDSFDHVDPAEGPSPSQSCLNLLDPNVRVAYNMAYTFAKNAHVAGELPDWTSVYLEECFANTPSTIQERMKNHFDRYFRDVHDRLAVSASIAAAAAATSPAPVDAANETTNEKEPPTQDEPTGSLYSQSSTGTLALSSDDDSGSEYHPVDDPPVDAAVVSNDSPADFPLTQTVVARTRSGRVVRDLGSTTSSAELPSRRQPAPSYKVRSSINSRVTGRGGVSKGCPQPSAGVRGSPNLGSSSSEHHPSRHGRAQSSRGQSVVSSTTGRLSSPPRAGPSRSAAPLGNPDVASSSDLSSRVATSAHSFPVLSNSARAVLLRSGPLYPKWEYLGLVRWAKGGLSEEVPLTFDEVQRETAKPRVGPERFPWLRERWQCRLCTNLRHEPVGQTSNLTKHHKNNKCSGQVTN